MRRRADADSLPAGSPALGEASAFIFDVEGTLVDAVMQTLRCWRETYPGYGYDECFPDEHSRPHLR